VAPVPEAMTLTAAAEPLALEPLATVVATAAGPAVGAVVGGDEGSRESLSLLNGRKGMSSSPTWESGVDGVFEGR